MKRNMKRIVSGLMSCLILMGLLIGCSMTNTPDSSEPAANGSTPSAPVETSPAIEKEVKITWLNHMQEEGKKAWVNSVVKACKGQYPEVTVTVETIASDNYLTVLQTKISSNDAPQVFDLYSNNDLKIYNESGYLHDLSSIESITAIDDSLLAEGCIKGTQYGVPMETSAFGVGFYNKDIFDKYSLTAPTTLSQLYSICKTLSDNGVQPFAAPMAEMWALKHYVRAVNDVLSVMPDADWYSKKMKLSSKFSTDEAFKNAISIYSSLKLYWGDDPFGTSWDSAQNLIANGDAAMLLHGSWAIDGILSKNPSCNIGIFAMPVSENPDDARIVKEPGVQLVCYENKDADATKAGEKLFETIFSSESQKNYAELANQMPAVRGDYDIVEPLKIIMNYQEDKTFMHTGIQKFTKEYEDIYYEAISSASLENTLDVDKLCKELDSQFSALQK